jgi:large repetitive protein
VRFIRYRMKMLRSRAGRGVQWLALGFLTLVMLASGLASPVQAQGSVQVVVTGVPPVLSSPYVADLVQQYEQGRFPLQLIYSTPSAQSATVRLRISMERDGMPLIEATSLPFALSPGVRTVRRFSDPPEIPFTASFSDLVNQLDGVDRQSVVQAGVLAEGMYQVTAEIIPENPDLLISSFAGSAMFTVRYVQPPVLISPSDQAVVTQAYPLFAWTPVLAPLDSRPAYELLLVEVRPDQTAYSAITSNPEHARLSVFDQTSVIYTPDLLPLENGRTYAWRLRAFDSFDQLAFSDNGLTEVYTFTYTPGGQLTEEIASLSSIVLEPGFASLVQLEHLQFSEITEGYRLNGEATLRFDTAPTSDLIVNLRDLVLQRGSIAHPVILAGEVTAPGVLDLLTEGRIADALAFSDLRWRFGDGFSVGADVLLGGSSHRADGRLRLTSAGLHGEVVVTGEPLMSFSGSSVAFDLTTASARFPEMQLRGKGEVRVFDSTTGCEVEDLDLLAPGVLVPVRCEGEFSVGVTEAAGGLALSLTDLRGGLAVDHTAHRIAYDIYTNGTLAIQTAPTTCGLYVSLRLRPDEGVSLSSSGSACSSYAAEVDLGPLRARLAHPTVRTVAYDDASRSWTIDLDLSASLALPAFSGANLPLTQVTVTQDGVVFPRLDLSEELDGLSPIEAAGIRLRLRTVSIP